MAEATLIYLSVLIIILYFNSSNVVGDIVYPCVTPDNTSGYCVSIFDCPDLIRSLYNMEPSAVAYAKQSICMECAAKNTTMVCCTRPHIYDDFSQNGQLSAADLTKKTVAIESRRNYVKKNLLHANNVCGQQHSSYRITPPGSVELDEYTWLVQIKHNDIELENSRCNGFIISRRYILTDRECGLKAKKVIFGQYDTTKVTSCAEGIDPVDGQITDCAEPSFEVSVESIIDFKPLENEMYGLSLIRINKSITYTDYVRPICLPVHGSKRFPDNTILTLTGWGMLGSGIKKELRSDITNNSVCSILSENLICLTPPQNINNGSICKQDVGGPLMYEPSFNNWHVEAIITSIHEQPSELDCTETNSVIGLLITPTLMNWILDNMQN